MNEFEQLTMFYVAFSQATQAVQNQFGLVKLKVPERYNKYDEVESDHDLSSFGLDMDFPSDDQSQDDDLQTAENGNAHPAGKQNDLANLNNELEEDNEEYWMIDNICLQYILTPKLPDKLAGILQLVCFYYVGPEREIIIRHLLNIIRLIEKFDKNLELFSQQYVSLQNLIFIEQVYSSEDPLIKKAVLPVIDKIAQNIRTCGQDSARANEFFPEQFFEQPFKYRMLIREAEQQQNERIVQMENNAGAPNYLQPPAVKPAQ